MSDTYRVLTTIDLSRPAPTFLDDIDDIMTEHFFDWRCDSSRDGMQIECDGKTYLSSGPPSPRMDRGLFDQMASEIKARAESLGLTIRGIKSCFIDLDQCNFIREA